MRMLSVGVTGTRKGMSESQRTHFRVVMLWLNPARFHHGGAVGADTEAETDVRALIEGPASLGIDTNVTEHLPDSRGPLARNRDIVQASDILIAAPIQDDEVVRSGTWATVRYARAAGIPVIMLSRGTR